MSIEYPLVTIGIPVYNSMTFLPDTISDALLQDYPNFTILISDNFSDDGSYEYCLALAEKDSRIKVIRQKENIGSARNFAALISASQTEYFAMLSSNNRFRPSYIRKCMEQLLSNPAAAASFSSLEFINKTGAVLNYGTDNPRLTGLNIVERAKQVFNLPGWYFFYCVGKTSMFRDVYLPAFQNKELAYGLDVHINLELVLYGEVMRVDEILYSYRQKFRDEHHRYEKIYGEGFKLNFPYAEVTLSLIDIIQKSDKITEDERKDILKFAFSNLSSSQIWKGRFLNYSAVDYLDIAEREEKYSRLQKVLPFKPSDLFLREKRIEANSGRPRIALLEFNHRHDEVIPSTVNQMSLMGYDVDVFMKDELTYLNNIWKCFPDLPCNIHIMEDEGGNYDKFIYWITAFRLIEYEFIIVNTLEGEHILDFVSNLPGRHYSILHNPSLLMQKEKYQNYYKNALHNHLFLHQMVVSKMPNFSDSPCFPPFLKVQSCSEIKKVQGTTTFAIQGNIEDRRNYSALIECLDALYSVKDDLPPFLFKIIGNCTTEFGKEVLRTISRKPWHESVMVTEGELSYPDFYSELASCDYILPLLDKSRKTFIPYFEDKLTSSVSVAFMMEIPPILHEDMADIYDISGITYNDEPDGLLTAIVYALQLPEEERIAIKHALAENREKIISEAGASARHNFQINKRQRELHYHQEALRRIRMGDGETALQLGEKLLALGMDLSTAYDIKAAAFQLIGDRKNGLECSILAYNAKPQPELAHEICLLMEELRDPRLADWIAKDSPSTGETSWRDRLKKYVTSGFNSVEGWVGTDFHLVVEKLQIIQDQLDIRGDLVEIGVHHGKFALLLDQVRRKDEHFVAIDLFENQPLNIDKSGSGSLSAFEKNARSWSVDFTTIQTVSADSLSLTAETIRSKSSRGYRLFSIDGGHTAEHTINDIILASYSICPGGVIFLDDYYNQDWPGVHEGFVKYMAFQNHRLAPFAYFQNKVMLCGISYHEQYYRLITELFKHEKVRIKETTMSGFKTASILKI